MPNTRYITNAFGAVGRMLSTRLRTSGGSILNEHVYTYNAASERTRHTRKDGSYVDYSYDALGQLRAALGKESGGVTNRLHEQLGYLYDAAGNLSTRTNNALLQSFGVNNLNQFTNSSRSGTLTVAGTSSSAATSVTVNGNSATRYTDWTFAKSGLTVTNGNNTFSAIATDTLGRADTNTVAFNLPATVSYTYDGNGNLTSDGTRGLDYDDENQLIRVTVTNNWKTEFMYDGQQRRRIRKEYIWQSSAWALAAEVRYIFDGNLEIQQRDGNNLPILTLTRGRDLGGGLENAGGIGGLLARTENLKLNTTGTANDAHAYFFADGNGNVVALVNANQQLVAKYLYDSFGNTISSSGPLADVNCYRFSSKELHIPSGLIYFGRRFYDPNLQRWVNKDPKGIEGGINLFGYVKNGSINRWDNYGLEWKIDRKGETMAAATATDASDTWQSLASLIGLDYKDSYVWVGNWEQKVHVGHQYSVPNTIYVDYGYLGWWDRRPTSIFSIWKREVDDEIQDFLKTGRRVIVTQNVGSDRILQHLRSRTIEEYFYIGHGNGAGGINGSDERDEDIVSPDRYTAYGIKEITIMACASADYPVPPNSNYFLSPWELNASRNGDGFEGYHGAVDAFNYGWRWDWAWGSNGRMQQLPPRRRGPRTICDEK